MTVINETVATIVDDHPEAVRDYYRDDVNNDGPINYLVGQVLVEVAGNADPSSINSKVENELEQREPTKFLAREAFMEGYEAGIDVEDIDKVTRETGRSLFEKWWSVNHD